MAVQLTIGDREAMVLTSVIAAIFIVSLATAFGGNNPAIMGHTTGEIDWSQAFSANQISAGTLCLGGECITTWSSDASDLAPGQGKFTASVQSSCGIVKDGTIRCWGYNAQGQLGDGTTDQATPDTVLGITDARQISGSANTLCAVNGGNGDLLCWGWNNYNQVGDGTATNKLTPVQVLGNVKQVSPSMWTTCALTNSNQVYCWGWNDFGQLGIGSTIQMSTPTLVPSLSNVVKVSCGAVHCCALISDGTMKCWGRNNNGQLGDGTITNRNTPAAVLNPVSGAAALSGIVDISAGAASTCAVNSAGEAYCWGSGYFGEIGNGTSPTSVPRPARVSITNAKNISIGYGHESAASYWDRGTVCAFLADTSVSCWGYNPYGQLGDGTTTNRNTPVTTVFATKEAVEVRSGSHTCVSFNDNALRCLGRNYYGQLGNGQTADSKALIRVSGF